MYRKFALCAALSIFLTVALLMWRMCDRDGSVIFLQQQRSADWILYPKPVVPYRQAVAELPAEFRRDFRLERVPGTAKLSVRACKRFLVSINGKAVQVHTPAVGWKQPQPLEVASYLRAGENTISILVFNDVAPPALWAALVGDGLSLNTDGSWQVSYAGAVWRPARLASKPPPAKD